MDAITWTRINNDVNGNYVCHFHALLTPAELSASIWDSNGRKVTPTKYEIAIKRANKIGGRKYHNKQYGGGIVFQSYNIVDTAESIRDIVAKAG